MRWIKPGVAVLALALLPFAAQAQQSPADSDYGLSVNTVFRTVHNPDSLRAYAAEWTDYYKGHPDTKGGRAALMGAFMVWANQKDLHSIHAAFPLVRTDSDAWASLVGIINVAYGNAKRWQEYPPLLDSLSTRITNPTSLAEICLMIGYQRSAMGQDSLARRSYAHVLALKADSLQTRRAEIGLYEIDSLRVGMPAPDFSEVDVEGKRIHLADYRGTNVLVEFTGTWCGPCQLELPNLKEIYSKYAARGKKLRFIAISLEDSVSTLKKYIKDKSVPWPCILTSKESFFDNSLRRRYNAQGVPRIFLIDAAGRMAAKDLRGDKLAEAVRKLVGS